MEGIGDAFQKLERFNQISEKFAERCRTRR